MGAYKIKSGGRVFGRTYDLLQAERQRAEMLEVMLFAFVHNRTTYPMGKALGKTEDEILLKTLETVNAGMKIVDFEKARERLMRARRLMKERSSDNCGNKGI